MNAICKTDIFRNNLELRDMFELFERIDFNNFDNNLDPENKTCLDSNKYIKKSNKLICINCDNSDKIIEDMRLGIVICAECGQVLDNIIDASPDWHSFDDDKGNTNRCGSGVSKLLPQSSLGTTIKGGNWNSRIKTLHNWSAMPYRERSLHLVFKQFQERCEKNGILRCIEDDAKIMYKAISECKHLEGKNKDKFIIIRGKNRISLIASCIFFACKRKGMTRSPKEIAAIFDIDYTDITRGCKNFQKFIKKGNIDINTGFSLPEDFVARFCKELHINTVHINHAIEIAKNIRKMGFASVHTPFSIATSSVLLMAEFNDLTIINKKKLAAKFGVSEVTISKTYKKLEKYKHILKNQFLVDKYIEQQEINEKSDTIPKHLYARFEKFNIPTDREQLLNFKFEYSKIFDMNTNTNIPNQDFLFNNIRNTDIKKLKIHIKKVSKKMKQNIAKMQNKNICHNY